MQKVFGTQPRLMFLVHPPDGNLTIKQLTTGEHNKPFPSFFLCRKFISGFSTHFPPPTCGVEQVLFHICMHTIRNSSVVKYSTYKYRSSYACWEKILLSGHLPRLSSRLAHLSPTSCLWHTNKAWQMMQKERIKYLDPIFPLPSLFGIPLELLLSLCAVVCIWIPHMSLLCLEMVPRVGRTISLRQWFSHPELIQLKKFWFMLPQYQIKEAYVFARH